MVEGSLERYTRQGGPMFSFLKGPSRSVTLSGPLSLPTCHLQDKSSEHLPAALCIPLTLVLPLYAAPGAARAPLGDPRVRQSLWALPPQG
jgi:hypothetical protein